MAGIAAESTYSEHENVVHAEVHKFLRRSGLIPTGGNVGYLITARDSRPGKPRRYNQPTSRVRTGKIVYQQLFDEFESHAHEGYCEAYRTWDRTTNVPFSAWLVAKVRYALLEGLRRRTKWSVRNGGNLPEEELMPEPQKKFEVDSLIDRVGLDAETVVCLVLSGEVEPELDSRMGWLKALRATLKSWGWTARRITESFAEIREALVR